jgi:V8-like Glu-specific endopeptidase
MNSRTRVSQQNIDQDYENPTMGSNSSSLGNGYPSSGNGHSGSTTTQKQAKFESGEEFVDEVMGSGDTALGQNTETGESTAISTDPHKRMSNPTVSRASEADEGATGEADESTETDSEFETEGVEWDESSLTETEGKEEVLTEAYFADVEAKEGDQEFFGAIAALALPAIKSLLPMVASTVIKQAPRVLNNPRIKSITNRLSRFGIKLPIPKRETGDYSEATEVEVQEAEATLEALEQQLDALEVIIEKDDRVRVKNTRLDPWKRICHLRIKAGNGKNYSGTGFFIGPRTILTAGHCVYIHGQGGWAKEIEVTPARDMTPDGNPIVPFSKFTARSFRSVKGWVTDKSRNYDYGVIQLSKNDVVSPEIGAFDFGVYADQFLLNKRLNTAGYPGDKVGKEAGTMWFHGRNAKSVTPRTIVYDIDTVGGQSGSPVWFKGADGKRIVVGIHTNGSPSGNSATRITRPVYENLKLWRKEAANS